MEKMVTFNYYLIVINRHENFSSVGEQFVKTEVALHMVNLALKKGIAKLIIDTKNTLSYQIAI